MSFYTSLSGLHNAQTELNVISNNIANSETTGFKKSTVAFSDLVAGSAYTNPKMTQGIGSTVQSITQNFSMGPVEQTGGALDVAISGDGFFSTKNPTTGTTLYTRNGSFTADDQGYITDGSGNRLQIFAPGADPTTATPIDAQMPATDAGGGKFAGVTIGTDGSVNVSFDDGTNQTIGKIGLAQFTAPTGLKQVGSEDWQATGLSGAASYGTPGQGAFGSLLSGELERSNVDVTEELVGLITAQRYYQANAKAIDTASQVTETILNLRN